LSKIYSDKKTWHRGAYMNKDETLISSRKNGNT